MSRNTNALALRALGREPRERWIDGKTVWIVEDRTFMMSEHDKAREHALRAVDGGDLERAAARHAALVQAWLQVPGREQLMAEHRLCDELLECWIIDWRKRDARTTCTVMCTETSVQIVEDADIAEVGLQWAGPDGPEPDAKCWYDDIDERVHPDRRTAIAATIERSAVAVSELEIELQHAHFAEQISQGSLEQRKDDLERLLRHWNGANGPGPVEQAVLEDWMKIIVLAGAKLPGHVPEHPCRSR